MALRINLRQLERHNVELEGELPAEKLDLADVDEVIHPRKPLRYKLEAQKLDNSILVQGWLEMVLDCECVRCLKPFAYKLAVRDWACHLPLEGEEKVVVTNDSIDLTPYLREDILLGFPQHPLCKAECRGLSEKATRQIKKMNGTKQAKEKPSAWAELNKLKF
jgi:uncharacterized protein